MLSPHGCKGYYVRQAMQEDRPHAMQAIIANVVPNDAPKYI